MGWFGGSSSTDKKQDQGRADPVTDLDPSLRDYLKKEAPEQYSTTNAELHVSPSPSSSAAPPPASGNDSGAAAPPPPESLFPDGRYAALWRTYTPYAQVEAAGKSEQEKLLDIVAGYKERKKQIGRAALENCSIEHMAVSDCFRFGSWNERVNMCRAQNKRFERCYTMQARFLKALAYGSTFERSPEQDERIQMHADTLFHRMLAQEAAIKKAKAEGRPEPVFEPVLSPATSAVAATAATAAAAAAAAAANSDEDAAAAAAAVRELAALPMDGSPPRLDPALRPHFEARLKGLSANEQRLEEMAIAAEIAIRLQVAAQVMEERAAHDEARERRREKGMATFGDQVVKLLRFKPVPVDPDASNT
ncbi:MAG: hypothetical protein M1826_000033 [Phylliscum demangeonii]|nr:MAG: hypothetical protein M1826_000033 [Phylliscum demangeonii]